MGLFGANNSSALGDLLSLDVKITEKDYFKGVKTILNSETVALKVVEDLYNSIPKGKNWTDSDFGPSE